MHCNSARSRYGTADAELSQMMELADSDRDGRVTLDDFYNIQTKH